MRDLCIGAVPPAGLTDWRYFTVALVAALLTMAANALVVRLAHRVILFDSLGLALFAVTGAQKATIFGHNGEVAVLLSIVTADAHEGTSLWPNQDPAIDSCRDACW